MDGAGSARLIQSGASAFVEKRKARVPSPGFRLTALLPRTLPGELRSRDSARNWHGSLTCCLGDLNVWVCASRARSLSLRQLFVDLGLERRCFLRCALDPDFVCLRCTRGEPILHYSRLIYFDGQEHTVATQAGYVNSLDVKKLMSAVPSRKLHTDSNPRSLLQVLWSD